MKLTMRTLVVQLVALMVLFSTVLILGGTAGAEVNIYSYRQPFLIKPIFEAFTKDTGIAVNVVFAKQGLVARLQAEGRNSPADLLFAVDVGRLNDAVNAGVLQPLRSAVLERNIPAPYRHAEGQWFGLTLRARIIYASKERVPRGSLSTYEQLADPIWRGRICTRSSSHPYNVALLASLIAHHGEEAAQKWAEAVAANLARKPQGNDRAQVRAISEGVCDVALGNSYYMGKMLEDATQSKWARAVYLHFPNQQGRGTHVNISGAGLTRSAKNRDDAVKLLEYLSGEQAQKLYAELNYEYPIKPGVPWSDRVASWGRFQADSLPLTRLAENRTLAIMVFDRAGFP